MFSKGHVDLYSCMYLFVFGDTNLQVFHLSLLTPYMACICFLFSGIRTKPFLIKMRDFCLLKNLCMQISQCGASNMLSLQDSTRKIFSAYKMFLSLS